MYIYYIKIYISLYIGCAPLPLRIHAGYGPAVSEICLAERQEWAAYNYFAENVTFTIKKRTNIGKEGQIENDKHHFTRHRFQNAVSFGVWGMPKTD